MADQYEIDILVKADGTQAVRTVDQFQTKLKGVEGAARQGFGGATRESSVLQGGLGNLQNVVVGLGTAFVAQFGVQGVLALRQMGQESVFAYKRFEALAGGPELVGDAMDILREKTGGAVTDMQLQTDAAGLMLTGLADTATEAGDLIALGLRLGGEAGVDALSRALKNNSIEMLDNLGISAADVRALSQQYRDAGMDSSEAFAAATLEIGQQTVERLGDAADAGITEWGRLVAFINNTVLGPSGAAFEVGETIARTFREARETVELIQLIDEMNQTRTGMDTGQALVAFLTGARVTSDQADGGAMQRIFQWQLGNLTERVTNSAFASVFSSFDATIGGLSDAETARRMMIERYASEGRQQGLYSMTGLHEELNALRYDRYGSRGSIGGQDLFSEADLRDAQEIAAVLAGNADMLKNASEGLYTDTQIERARQMADQAREWADYVETGKEALQNMTMPQLFGQGVTNPLLAGLGDSFLETMRGELPADQMQALEDALGLRTGEQTPDSLAWRDEGLAALEDIYYQYGQDAALTALEAYEAGARAAREDGDTLPDPLEGMGYFMAAPFGGGEERPVPFSALTNAMPVGFGLPLPINAAEQAAQRAGEGPWGASGMAPNDPLMDMLMNAEDLSGKIGGISDQLSLLPGAMTPATDEWSKQLETAGLMKTAVENLTGTNYKIRIAWEAMDMSNVPPLMREVIRQELAAIVRANGGVVPGSDARARPNSITRAG